MKTLVQAQLKATLAFYGTIHLPNQTTTTSTVTWKVPGLLVGQDDGHAAAVVTVTGTKRGYLSNRAQGSALLNAPSDRATTIYGIAGHFCVAPAMQYFCKPDKLPYSTAHLDGAQYVRVQQILACPGQATVWDKSNASDAISQAAQFGLVPIIDFVTPDLNSCSQDALSPADWVGQMRAFGTWFTSCAHV